MATENPTDAAPPGSIAAMLRALGGTQQDGRGGPLAGVRVLDLTWLLAGAGASRFLAALDAEVIRLEWRDRIDFLRLGPPSVYRKGEAHAPLVIGGHTIADAPSLNRNGFFNNINSGKLGLSLNLGLEEGKEIFRRLVRVSDVVIESFSATAMDRMGLGYEELKREKPDLVYVQASGFGKQGPRSSYLSYGPTSQAMSGLTYQSGFPDREPAGWGFSYMDHSGAYFLALATIMALCQHRRTGEGLYVDLAQAASAVFLTGTSTLDHFVNGRDTTRTGNGSPNAPACPHGVFPVAGVDRWIAIAVFDDAEWRALVEAMGSPEWALAPDLQTTEGRLARQEAVESGLAVWTRAWEPFELMRELQNRGVASGVCQTAEDRVAHDPQLEHRGYLVDLEHSEIGRWPVENVPFRLATARAEVGMATGRAAPCYGEDTDLVLRELLGFSPGELVELREKGVC
jgi:crotonobetainyl-CoA:carnitine CoA-transferase CaiB-like acyl-CoA transferase